MASLTISYENNFIWWRHIRFSEVRCPERVACYEFQNAIRMTFAHRGVKDQTHSNSFDLCSTGEMTHF